MIRIVETFVALSVVVLYEALWYVSHRDLSWLGIDQNPQPEEAEVVAQARGACMPPTTEVEPEETGVVWPVSSALYEIGEVTACSSR